MSGVGNPVGRGPSDQILLPSLPVWLQALFLLLIIVFYGWAGVREYRTGRLRRSFWLAPAGTILALLLIFNQGRYTGIGTWVVAVLGLHATQALAAVIVIFLGWGAHEFKRRSKLYYGYLEVCFGALSAIAIVTTVNFVAVQFSNLRLTQILGLVGSAYVVARGLNNCYEARHSGVTAR
jgi:hypothetical protein